MSWIRPLWLTLEVMGLSVLLAAVIGITLAFLISLVSRPSWLARFTVAFCLVSLFACLATPMILHAAAWEATAGKFGWMTFSQTAARTYTGLAGRYSGLVAAVWIHGLYGAALAALATWYGTTRIAADVLDQSRLDGGPVWAWWRVRLPIATPWVVVALLVTAILAATEMTVVDLYGVRTLADEFYLFHAADPSIVSILMVLVVPSVLVISLVTWFSVSLRHRFDVSLVRNGSPADRTSGENRRVFGGVASLVVLTTSVFLFAFPFLGLLYKTGQAVVVAGGRATVSWSWGHASDVLVSALGEYRQEYQWTVILAAAVAAVCVPVGWCLASITRGRPVWERTVEITSLVIFLIPGPIVGLMVVHLFTMPIPGFQTLYQQTLVPTVLALMVRALPVSFWVLRAGYAGIESAVVDVARLDFSWWGRMWRVDGPLLARPLAIAGFASAVVASGDVPVMLPVLPPGVVTVGTRLFALLHSGARNQEAALAFWYVGSIVAVGIVLCIRWKPDGR